MKLLRFSSSYHDGLVVTVALLVVILVCCPCDGAQQEQQQQEHSFDHSDTTYLTTVNDENDDIFSSRSVEGPDPNRVIVTFKEASSYRAAVMAAATETSTTYEESAVDSEFEFRDEAINATTNASAWAGLISRDTTNVHLRFDHSNAFAATMSPQAAAGLQNDPRVLTVEQDPVRYLGNTSSRPSRGKNLRPQYPVEGKARSNVNSVRAYSLDQNNTESERIARHQRRLDTEQVVPYGIKMIQANKVAYQGGKTVCILDTGYNLGHEDLPRETSTVKTQASNRQQQQQQQLQREQVVNGFNDPTGGRQLPWHLDGHGHGTHVAGTIAAQDNGRGVLGVAPGVNLYIVRLFGDSGGWAYESDVVHAVHQCVYVGRADVVNMSLGGTEPSSWGRGEFQRIYRQLGVLLVAAAMNSGSSFYYYPASYNSVISVAAVNKRHRVAKFSQRNDQVELAAPGVSVLSTVPYPIVRGEVTLSSGYRMAAKSFLDSPEGNVTGTLLDCDRDNGGFQCKRAIGKVCVIRRDSSSVSVGQHLVDCENGGGIAVIFHSKEASCYDHRRLGRNTTLPAACVDQSRSRVLTRSATRGLSATVAVSKTSYPYTQMDGTSMSTPHISGAAALIWSNHPDCTNRDVRLALTSTAEHRKATTQLSNNNNNNGEATTQVRDNAYGFGIVKAKRANQQLRRMKCHLQP